MQGHNRVSEWMTDPEHSADGETLDNIPFEETKNYVEREKTELMKSTNFYINWRKLAVFTMAICLLLVFSACGSSPQPSEEMPTPSAAKELPMPEGTGTVSEQEPLSICRKIRRP